MLDYPLRTLNVCIPKIDALMATVAIPTVLQCYMICLLHRCDTSLESLGATAYGQVVIQHLG